MEQSEKSSARVWMVRSKPEELPALARARWVCGRRARGRRDGARPGEVDDARLLVCVARWRSAVLDP